jgi:two-component system, LytTR family, sensor kinase
MRMRPISMRVINTKLGKRFFSSLSFWKLNLSSWLLFGIACLLARVYYYPNLPAGLAQLLWNFLLSVGLSALLRQVYRRTPLREFFELKTMGVVTLCSLIAGLVQAGVAQSLVNHMAWGNPELSRRTALTYRVEFTWLLFTAWGLGYYGLKAKAVAYTEMLRSRDSRAATRNMELQLLRNRLEPHFLFNSLNGIAAEIAPHPVAASELIHDVSDYLRYLLDHRDHVSSPLSEELAAMESYLKIERARFGERLQTSVQATRPARRTVVPSFLLQSLVENAVKHASWPREGPLKIDIVSTKEDSTLTISVTNTGELKAGHHDGVGLSTLRRLLELQYPRRHDFKIANGNGTVIARLILQGTPCSVS